MPRLNNLLKMGAEGVEPSTSSLSEKRSTAEPRALKIYYINNNI